jgi:hypothetical protein
VAERSFVALPLFAASAAGGSIHCMRPEIPPNNQVKMSRREAEDMSTYWVPKNVQYRSPENATRLTFFSPRGVCFSQPALHQLSTFTNVLDV